MVRLFTDVALGGPISALLVLFGALFVGFAVVFFGYLTLGAFVDALVPSTVGRQPPTQ